MDLLANLRRPEARWSVVHASTQAPPQPPSVGRARWPRAADASAQLDTAPKRGGAAKPHRRLGAGYPPGLIQKGRGGQHDRTPQSPASAGLLA